MGAIVKRELFVSDKINRRRRRKGNDKPVSSRIPVGMDEVLLHVLLSLLPVPVADEVGKSVIACFGTPSLKAWRYTQGRPFALLLAILEKGMPYHVIGLGLW